MLIVEIYVRSIASTVFFVKYFLQFISKNTFYPRLLCKDCRSLAMTKGASFLAPF